MRNKDNTITFNNGNNWIKKELTLPRAKRTIKALVGMMLSGKVDYKILGNLYRPNQAIPEATVKRFLKHSETKKMIDKELELSLNKFGINQDYLIENRKFILEEAKGKDRLETMLKALSGFEMMLGMDKAVKETKTITESINMRQLLENGTKNEIELTQTRPIESAKMEDFTDKTLSEDDKEDEDLLS